MDARRPAGQQLGGAAQAPFLHLLGAEGGDADLGDPDRQMRRPRGSCRSWPATRRSSSGSSRAGSRAPRPRRASSSTPWPSSSADEIRVDRRHAAEHARQARRLGRDRLAGEPRHAREHRPVRVVLEIPMRLVVGLVPDHRRFDHRRAPSAARGIDRAVAVIRARSTRRQMNTSSSGLALDREARRCAASPPSRPGSAPTSWWGRARSCCSMKCSFGIAGIVEDAGLPELVIRRERQ